MGEIILHVGFPKTATTTLQSVLMESRECHYLGKGLRDTMAPSTSLDIARAVLFADTRRFEDAAPELEDRLAALAAEHGRLVISDEAFSFAEHMKIGRQWDRQVVSDHAVVAARLARLAPGARVLMSVRHQLSFVVSFYRQSIKGDGFTGSFEDYVGRELAALPHRSMLHLLRYDEAFEAYAGRFGADRVRVWLYEDYVQDFGRYLDEVAAVCGFDAGDLRRLWGGRHDNKAKVRRPREDVESLIRLVPPVLRKVVPSGVKQSIRRQTAKPPEPAEFSAEQTARLAQWFAEPNRALAAATGLDLAAHDYPGLSSGRRSAGDETGM